MQDLTLAIERLARGNYDALARRWRLRRNWRHQEADADNAEDA
jgi:hypothetical protein